MSRSQHKQPPKVQNAASQPFSGPLLAAPVQRLKAELQVERFLNGLNVQLHHLLLAAFEAQDDLPAEPKRSTEDEIFQCVVEELQSVLGEGVVAIALSDRSSSGSSQPLIYQIRHLAPSFRQAVSVAVPILGQIPIRLGTMLSLHQLRQHHTQSPQQVWPIRHGNRPPIAWLLVLSSQPEAVQAVLPAPSNLDAPLALPLEEALRRYLMEQTVYHCTIAVQQAQKIQATQVRQHKLEAQNRDLVQMNQHKSEFLANTSHEIRTPLSSILGFTRLLQEQTYNPSNRRHQEYLNIILSSGRHLLALINDILDLSKIEANQLDLQWETVDVNELCRNVLLLVKEKASNKGLQLRLDIDPEVTTFVADPLRLKQMLFNLLSNALKFTSQGSVGLRVKAVGVYLHFLVWDTGPGIDKASQAKLFRPYTQVTNSLTEREEGTGLGLSLTQKLAQLHGGWIELQSELHRGSEFTIVLPLTPGLSTESEAPPPATDELPTQAEPEKAAIPARRAVTPSRVAGSQARSEELPAIAQSVPTAIGLQTGVALEISKDNTLAPATVSTDTGVCRLLLVEDSATNAKLMITYLCRLGCEITWAKTAQEMWSALQHSVPVLILMDVQLPDVDGLSLIQQLKTDQRYAHIPIIVQTAKAMSGDRETCMATGATDYVSKPLDLKKLGELVLYHSGYVKPPARETPSTPPSLSP